MKPDKHSYSQLLLDRHELLCEFVEWNTRYRVVLDAEKEAIELHEFTENNYGVGGEAWYFSDSIRQCDNFQIYEILVHLARKYGSEMK